VRHDVVKIQLLASEAALQTRRGLGNPKSEYRNPKQSEQSRISEKGRKLPGLDIFQFSVFPQLVSDFGFRYSDFLAARKLDVVASNFKIQGLYAAGVEPAWMR
jgi:hypothetical protein